MAFILLALVLSACDDDAARCRPTTTAARRAAVVDLSEPQRSSVLSATLRWGKRPLAGKPITFVTHRKSAIVIGDRQSDQVGDAQTSKTGVASFDLKTLPPATFAKEATSDDYTATFAGDRTYCASSGTTAIDKAQTPAAVPTTDHHPPASPPAITPTPSADVSARALPDVGDDSTPAHVEQPRVATVLPGR